MKLYADETDADTVRSVPFFVVSALARVEVPAALWRKTRTGELSAQDAAVLVAAFVADWHDRTGPFVAVGLRGPVLEQAASLVAAHGLRADDGVQLACASSARQADPEIDVFLCFDNGLGAAAAREGFAQSV